MRPSPGLIDVCWALPFLTAGASFLFCMPKTNSGLLFVFFVDYFECNICYGLYAGNREYGWKPSCETGFAIGAAFQRISVYGVAMAGSVLCPIAIIASCFVPDMTWMAVTMGVLYGMSFGLLMISASVYTVSYFKTYSNTATGIRFLGVSLCGVIGPSLLSHLSSTYGLQGCLLVTGALTLNLIPLTLLLRNPRPHSWPQFFHCLKSGSAKNKANMSIASASTAEDARGKSWEPQKCAQHVKHGVSRHPDDKVASTFTISQDEDPYWAELRPPASPAQCVEQSSFFSHGDDVNGIIAQLWFVLTKPCFYVILIAMVAADFILPLLGETLVDYGIDKHLAPIDSSYLLTCLSLGGVCGYVLVPIVSDKCSRHRCVIAALSFISLSICFVVFPHVYSYPATAALTFVSGVQQGYLSTLKPVLVADYLGVQSVAVSWGLMGLASLPITFCEPSIIGFFRDGVGSYDGLYRLCGGVSFVATLALSLQACFDARKSSATSVTSKQETRIECETQHLSRF